MARKRSVSPDFWTWEAVIDCPAMTRLLFIGLWNVAAKSPQGSNINLLVDPTDGSVVAQSRE